MYFKGRFGLGRDGQKWHETARKHANTQTRTGPSLRPVGAAPSPTGGGPRLVWDPQGVGASPGYVPGPSFVLSRVGSGFFLARSGVPELEYRNRPEKTVLDLDGLF